TTGLALFLKYRERNFNQAIFLSNLFVAASGLTHPLGILYLAALIFLVLYFDGTKVLGFKPLLVSAVPYLVGGAAWGMYILEDPKDFVAQFSMCLRAGGRMSAWSAPFHSLWTELMERYLRSFGLGAH